VNKSKGIRPKNELVNGRVYVSPISFFPEKSISVSEQIGTK
jgi:hypothetical protein